MKKKFALLLLSLLCLCACAIGLSACNIFGGGNNDDKAGFKYSWNYDEHGELDGYAVYYSGKTKESVLIIPSEYEGEPVTGIRYSAFKDCTSLESVTLPDTITSIGNSAFEGCTSLKSINIPATLTSIDSSAFEGCTSLTEITIPDSVTQIGYSAFKNCPIEIATMPALACGYVSNPKLKTVVLTSGNSINQSAFKDCTSLESATLPATLTSIGSSAFEGCSSLKNVIIPDSVTEIGNFAFKDCPIETATMPAFACGYVSNPKLKTVVLTSGDSIDQSAFNGCAALENLTLPATLTSIGGGAFSGCASLKELAFPEKDCVLTYIGGSAFAGCTSLETVTIPESITEIGSGAFTGCEKLRAVHWNAENATAGSGIFSGCCTAINDWNGMILNIGSKVKKIPAAFSDANIFRLNFITGSVCEEIAAGAFEYCDKLTLVNLPESLKTIGSKAFRGCKSLFKMNIPKNVETIDTDAFDGCEKLIEVYNGSQLTVEKESNANGSVAYYAKNVYNPKEGGTKIIYSGYYAFYNDNNDYYLIGSQDQNCNTFDDKPSLNLPKGVMQYGVKIAEYYKLYKYAFAYRNDNSVYIPANVTEYGDYALEWLPNLKSIEVDNNSSILASQDGILYNKAKTKIVCVPKAISGAVSIPDSVTSIGNYTFSGCSNLTSITVDENNPNYSSQDGILYNKAKTEFVCIPYELNGDIIIPDGVTSIGNNAFKNRTELTGITIPNSVTNIGEEAFYGCKSLRKVYITNLENWCNITIHDSFNYFYNLYINGEIAANIVIPNNINEIKAYAFNGCKSIQTISIGSSVTNIGKDAFSNCISLTTITIPDSVTSIGEEAFFYCTSLTSITIPDSVTFIGKWAFHDCTSLTSITVDENNPNYSSQDGILYNKAKTEIVCVPKAISGAVSIPDGVTSIGGYAFYDCSSLTSITIPSSVTTIGSYAFYNCRLLTSITYKGTIAQWKAINTLGYWGVNTGDFIVHCTDGTISKDGTVTEN